MMNLKPWENYVYQPFSTASIRLIRENQKFLDFSRVLAEVSLKSMKGSKTMNLKQFGNQQTIKFCTTNEDVKSM